MINISNKFLLIGELERIAWKKALIYNAYFKNSLNSLRTLKDFQEKLSYKIMLN